MIRLFLTAAPLALIAGAAQAGEDIIYQATPEWVAQADVVALAQDDGPAQLLFEWQYRIEDGVVYAYTDRAIRIDNPQSLMEENTLSFTWLPDKGDLTVHRLEIIRDGEVIDLKTQGAEFDVIRREQGLEQRLLDGQLTATLSVPGLREGDVLRTAYTTSVDDQALGDEVQVLQYLPSEPWQIGQSRAVVSWPADEEMYWAAEERVDLGEPVRRGDDLVIDLTLPLAEPDPLPADAPWRYRRPAVLRVSSFASWNELSQVMYPHFAEAAQIADGSPVAAQAKAIMDQTDDPRQRAALATQLVQDEVSYLLNGLDGGNYLPQSVSETWEVRYGDCKAKSVLLHALLLEMGIASEVVLVSSGGGDALPELLPIPGAFDHVIVRAQIDGVDYWLDGTSTGTRIGNMDRVPPFYFALPLTGEGDGLVEMVQRNPSKPELVVEARLDHTAGVDFPTLYTYTYRFNGAASAQMRAIVDADDPEMRRQIASNFISDELDGMQVSDLDITYDHEMAEAFLTITGVASPEFDWANGRMRMDLSLGGDEIFFNPDRTRRSWRAIPVMTQGTSRVTVGYSVQLPGDGEGFRLIGDAALDASFANTRLMTDAVLDGGMVTVNTEILSLLGEVAVADLPEARRAARRISRKSLEVAPPDDIIWRWERSAPERAALAEPIVAAYSAAIVFADADNHVPLQWRASFKSRIYDYEGALEDLDILVEVDPGVWVYQQRARAHHMLGNTDEAIADMRAAMDIDSSNNSAFSLIDWLAYGGKLEEAENLLFALPVGEEDKTAHVGLIATLAGLDGRIAEGHEELLSLLADKPQDASALNSDCWFRGLFLHELETALDVCTRAVERADFSASALDSRALVHYRLGDLPASLADLDAALSLAPWVAASQYLRGVVLADMGDKNAAKRSIETALTISPVLPITYDRHGIKPAL